VQVRKMKREIRARKEKEEQKTEKGSGGDGVMKKEEMKGETRRKRKGRRVQDKGRESGTKIRQKVLGRINHLFSFHTTRTS
jgi:hypothetical protein